MYQSDDAYHQGIPASTTQVVVIVNPGGEGFYFYPTSLPKDDGGVEKELIEYDATPWYKTNFFCLFFSIATLTSLCFFIYSEFFSVNPQEILGGRVSLGVCYGLYFIEAFFVSTTPRYLWNQTDPEGIDVYVDRVKCVPPQVVFHVECYHYETHYRTVTDSNGNTRTESYTEKVVTHRASENLQFSTWNDVSGELKGVGTEYRMTRCRFKKSYMFADERSRDAYEYQWDYFKKTNNRDTHMDAWIHFHINGYIARKLAIVGEHEMHCCVHLAWYLVSSLFLGSYIYRSWFQDMSVKQSFEFVKCIKI